jgi:hypothetical protein
MTCHCADDKILKGMSLKRIQRGYSELEKQSGSSLTNMNLLAYMAVHESDYIVADQLFSRIGENRDDYVWNQPTFEKYKQWIAAMAPDAKFMNSVYEAEAANLQSPEGSRYSKEISSRLLSVLQGCSEASSGNATSFTLDISIEKNGKLGQMRSSDSSPVVLCFIKKLAEWQNAKTAPFPPPPQPSYWLAFTINPALNNVQVAHILEDRN